MFSVQFSVVAGVNSRARLRGGALAMKHAHADGAGAGFLQRFDIDDVLGCAAPRSIFVVSSENDPQTADAANVVAEAQSIFRAQYCENHLTHLRMPGPHALDEGRADAMVEWMVTEARGQE